jgi:hypothetical protein
MRTFERVHPGKGAGGERALDGIQDAARTFR